MSKPARAKPVRYAPRIAEVILERIAGGESLRAVCGEAGMPSFQSWLRWVAEDRDGLRARYSVAIDMRAQFLVDELIEIADTVEIGERTKTRADGSKETLTGDIVERSKLRCDARKWAASRLAPKRYGDRLAQEISGPDGEPVRFDGPARPSPEEVRDYARALQQGFADFRSEEGEAADLVAGSLALAEAVAMYAAGQENTGSRKPEEIGAAFAQVQLIRRNLRALAGLEPE
jgi:hypothetical protein